MKTGHNYRHPLETLKYRLTTLCLLWCITFSLWAQGTFPVQLTDDFASRPMITLNPLITIYGLTSNSTLEANEPVVEDISSGHTVWGSWIAPSNGIVTLAPSAGMFIPLLTVYTGDALTNLSLVASNNYVMCYENEHCGCHWRERDLVNLHVKKGEAYQICVDSPIVTDSSDDLFDWGFITNTPEGYVWLELEFTPAPQNDDFANRRRLSGTRVAINTSNAGATKEPGEPDHLGNPGGSSIWYSWTAPASGRVTLSSNEPPVYSPPSSGEWCFSEEAPNLPPVCGNEIDQNPPPGFYPIFAAYTGTAVDALTPANCLLMSLDTYSNAVEFDVVKGETYQIAFDGNMGTTSEIRLNLALTTPASNNNFNRRIPLHGVSVIAKGYNAGATRQSGEPLFGGSSGKSVWWTWTAPTTGAVSLDLSASDYPFPVAVFTGSSVSNLQVVAEGTSGLSFNAVQGQTYQIAVSDYNGLTGAIELTLLGTIVDLPLRQLVRQGGRAVLSYGASRGEVVALLRSPDDENWEMTQRATAVVNVVQFNVQQGPTQSGPFYRAVIFDRVH
jgi:hypothetical protein